MYYKLAAVSSTPSDTLRKQFFTHIGNGNFAAANALIPMDLNDKVRLLKGKGSPSNRNLFHWMIMYLKQLPNPTQWITTQLQNTDSEFYKFLVTARLVAYPFILDPDSNGVVPHCALIKLSHPGSNQIDTVLRNTWGTQNSNSTITYPLRHALLWSEWCDSSSRRSPRTALVIGTGRTSEIPNVAHRCDSGISISFKSGEIQYSPEYYELACIYPDLRQIDIIDSDKESLDCSTNMPPAYSGDVFPNAVKIMVKGQTLVREKGLPPGARWHRPLQWDAISGISDTLSICRNARYDIIMACHVLTYPLDNWSKKTDAPYTPQLLTNSSRLTLATLVNKLTVGGQLVIDYTSCLAMAGGRDGEVEPIKTLLGGTDFGATVHIQVVLGEENATDPPRYFIFSKRAS